MSPAPNGTVRRADGVKFESMELSELVGRGELRRLDGLDQLIPRSDLAAIPRALLEAGRRDGACWAPGMFILSKG